jgi:RND superfamily putative drug exporter
MTASGMARVARWSIAYRWLVIAGWVLLAVAGGLAAARSGRRLSFAFDLPGQPAYETNTAIAQTFGSGGSEPPLVTVVRLPRGDRSVAEGQGPAGEGVREGCGSAAGGADRVMGLHG